MPPTASSTTAGPLSAPAARVLILEDDAGSTFILKKILARGRYEIAGVARSSEEAIELARTTKPDLLLMDIQVPGKQDGVDAAKRILSELDVPLIYMTAYSDEATIERARRTAPFAYLLKPYREKEMLITIEMALYKARIDRLGKASEQRLAATLGVLEDYVFTTDAAGRMTYLNPAAERMLGKTAQQCLGHPLGELLDLRERETRTRLPDIVERVLRADFRTNPAHPLVLMKEKNEARLVQIQTNALTETDGLAVGRVVILRDVTLLDELEENIRRAQKLDAVGRLAGGISHDFNNLLAIINSFADLLLLKAQPGDPLEKYYRNIRAAGQRGTDLVSRLMNFSRRAATPPQAVAPAEIVREVEKMMRPLFRENIELVIDVPSDCRNYILTPAKSSKFWSIFASMPATPSPKRAASPSAWPAANMTRRRRRSTVSMARESMSCSRSATPAAAFRRKSATGFLSRFSPPRKWAKAPAWGWPWFTTL